MIKNILLTMIWVFAACGARAAENHCVSCHAKITKEDSARPSHNFEDWKQSVHARSGVSCDACHGGNVSAAEAAAAHHNMKTSTDPQSKIFFDNIPETCGACHARELAGFKRSAHYKALETTGKGPNCVTCHGSMATQVLDPRSMEAVCTLCHRKPTQAYAAYLNMLNTRKLLDQTRDKIAASKSRKIDVAGQSAAYETARKTYGDALETWHAFDMSRVLKQTQDAGQRLRGAQHELELKAEPSGAGGAQKGKGKK